MHQSELALLSTTWHYLALLGTLYSRYAPSFSCSGAVPCWDLKGRLPREQILDLKLFEQAVWSSPIPIPDLADKPSPKNHPLLHRIWWSPHSEGPPTMRSLWGTSFSFEKQKQTHPHALGCNLWQFMLAPQRLDLVVRKCEKCESYERILDRKQEEVCDSRGWYETVCAALSQRCLCNAHAKSWRSKIPRDGVKSSVCQVKILGPVLTIGAKSKKSSKNSSNKFCKGFNVFWSNQGAGSSGIMAFTAFGRSIKVYASFHISIPFLRWVLHGFRGDKLEVTHSHTIIGCFAMLHYCFFDLFNSLVSVFDSRFWK